MLKLPPPKNKPSKPKAAAATSTTASTTTTTTTTTALSLLTSGVKASFSDLIPAGPGAAVERCEVEANADQVAKSTSQALTRIVNAKVANVDQTQLALEKAQSKPTSSFIKVSGSTDTVTGKTSQDRVIRIAEKAVDPLEPAKFKFRAVPKPPGSPPVPVLHSPTHKATDEEKAAWDIPASVSNWINSQGYVVSLEKRLAQKAPQEAPSINENFAKLADALLTAEDTSRLAVAERAKLKAINEERKREAENEALRISAAQARNARNRNGAAGSLARRRSSSSSSSSSGGNDEEDEERRKERDRIRNAKKRELEREMRKESAGRRTKAMREEDRDISEIVALGMPFPKGGSKSVEMEFDQRLFNKGSAGLNSGHGAEDEDNLYTTSLFKPNSESIYKPSSSVRDMKSATELQSKLDELKGRDDKFEGFKGSQSRTSGPKRDGGPVQFEAAPRPQQDAGPDDPLQGMAFSSAQRKLAKTLDGLSSRNVSMSASRFSGVPAASNIRHSLDEPSEQELMEDRMINKLQAKQAKSRSITFVDGTDQ